MLELLPHVVNHRSRWWLRRIFIQRPWFKLGNSVPVIIYVKLPAHTQSSMSFCQIKYTTKTRKPEEKQKPAALLKLL